MKKRKSIRIKNPTLKKIRNELRNLLFSAKSAKIHEILDKKQELQQTEGFWDENHPNYKTLHKKTQELSIQENKLSSAFSKSIIFCPVCMKMDKDMTYNPYYEEWYCMECYEANRVFYIEEGRPDLYP